MPRSENQKLKVLYVAKFFLENSDEDHAVSAKDIIDYLEEEHGISADRRSIYRDVVALRDVFGFDIEGRQGGRYRLMSRQFEYDDLYLLAECVHAAKFISAAKAKELVESISEFASIYQAEKMKNEVFLCDRVKTTQKGILTIIATIRAAMAKTLEGKPHTPQKISFKYTKHVINNLKEAVERRGGERYVVSPYKLLINEGNYYLLAFSDKAKAMRTFRVDRMKDVRLIDEPRDGGKVFGEISMEDYAKRVFSMFGGERRRVSICFENKLLDTVIERFGVGSGTLYRPEGEDRFVVTTEVEISPLFFGWICGFHTKAKIVNPPETVENMRLFLEDISYKYIDIIE